MYSSLWLQTSLGLSPIRAGLQGSAPLSLAAFVVSVLIGRFLHASRPRLIIGPWAHGQIFGAFPGRRFGALAGADGIDTTALQLQWFDHVIKGTEGTGVDPAKPVKIFVMGPDVWRDEADWPLPDTEYTNFYLGSGGRANSAAGDGALSLDGPGDDPDDVYLYDPRDPVPTVGGETFLPSLPIGANSGPHDQAEVERRRDVLCFTSDPMTADLEVIGPVELVLHASSSAPDTDFIGKLVDVHPDGRAEMVTDGILRARYRESPTEPRVLEPNQVYELRIDMSATATVFVLRSKRGKLLDEMSTRIRWAALQTLEGG